MALTLSFDIGYASIGWCVLSAERPAPAEPEILGTGVVTFPADDCLASQRRALRRSRRHIRSTRLRIARMKLWLQYRGILSQADIEKPGHPAPFLLAAAALQGHRTLSAREMWCVLRWYAHNRGYDGNSRWARNEANEEDSEKEQAARALMTQEPQTETMAETVCKCLGLNPAACDQKISSHLPYKTLNAAYPREVVEKEVIRIVALHRDHIPGLDGETVRMLLKSAELTDDERLRLREAGIKLPKRYFGGLLFGQLVPRFDNRIISRCPITWADVYDREIKEGKTDADARKTAEKFAKVPAAKSTEFLEYRFARILANLRAKGEPLPLEARRHLFELAKKRGKLSEAELRKEIELLLGTKDTNLEAYFKIHPDSEKALVIDPAAVLPNSNKIVKAIWPVVPVAIREWALDEWHLNHCIRPAELIDKAHEIGNAEFEAIETALLQHFRKLPKKESTGITWEGFLLKPIKAGYDAGRAPYARPVLRQVVEEVLAGYDPSKPAKSIAKPDGEMKEKDGVLYPLMDPTSRVRQLQDERPLDQLTNNHLVRHRLMILDRLADDIVEEFCTGDKKVDRVIVEVARELREFSGMTAKQIASELNSRLKDFKGAVAYLEKYAPHIDRNGSIIRKCRIAMDLDWCCPFTGEKYDACDLPTLEREHIIPYATRNTNALHALVLTWPEVNRMKGKRTARQFIADNEGKPIEGKPNISLFTLRRYDEFVEKLDMRGHPDDARRKKARKALLATTDFEDKELWFTEGQLTQSSHLMKLAMGSLKRKLPQAAIEPMPGPVTAEIRKAWKLTGTLSLACPEVIDENGDVLPKNEIRGLTHLHHALDAATLAYASHYFPLQAGGYDQKGKIWQALLKRNRSEQEIEFLYGLGIFVRYLRKKCNQDGSERHDPDVMLRDLSPSLKEQLARKLAECRVMQHVPADRSGLPADANPWGFNGWGEDGRAMLIQRSFIEDGKPNLRPDKTRVYSSKNPKSGADSKDRVFGTEPRNGVGKLKNIGAVLLLNENYGVAIDPVPVLIPYKDVHKRIKELQAASGFAFRILRGGMLIRLKGHGDRDGIWRVDSIQATDLKIDLIKPIYTSMKEVITLPDGKTKKRNRKGYQVWRERPLMALHDPKNDKCIEILLRRYTSYPSV